MVHTSIFDSNVFMTIVAVLSIWIIFSSYEIRLILIQDIMKKQRFFVLSFIRESSIIRFKSGLKLNKICIVTWDSKWIQNHLINGPNWLGRQATSPWKWIWSPKSPFVLFPTFKPPMPMLGFFRTSYFNKEIQIKNKIKISFWDALV